MTSNLEKCSFSNTIKEVLFNLYENLHKHKLTEDISINDGVLTWKVQKVGDYLFNKQTPTKQLWVSSPVTGPYKFDFINCYFYNKKNKLLFDKYLKNELKEIKRIKNDI
ncbi:iron donor protein [Tubulinosema ratisbonensis]|uniref:Iron donor protein n=1 Tax=Tubulinosema ratisbonensis TaxID=291195 RepID=A0A437AM45_9MICR|nr:iron donor protein [Tubulinosema ratisbonensis]